MGEQRRDERDEILSIDKQDLMALLSMRFGERRAITVAELVQQIDQSEVLSRLVLVAANVATWEIFLEELDVAGGSFRLEGERFEPLGSLGDK